MRRVDRPMWEPYRCAFTLKDQDPEGFVVGEVIKGFDPHAFASISWVKQTARELGMVDPTELEALVEEQARTIEDLKEQLQEADRQLAAIDVLQSHGYTARRKPGRPKTKVEA